MKKKVIILSLVAIVIILLTYMVFVKLDFGMSNKDSFLEFLKPIENSAGYVLDNGSRLLGKAGNVNANLSIQASTGKIILTSLKEEIDGAYDFNLDKYYMTNDKSSILLDLTQNDIYLNKSGDNDTYLSNSDETDNKFISTVKALSNLSKNLSSSTYKKVLNILYKNLNENYFFTSKSIVSYNTYTLKANNKDLADYFDKVIQDIKKDNELMQTVSNVYSILSKDTKISLVEMFDNFIKELKSSNNVIDIDITLKSSRAKLSELSMVNAKLIINDVAFDFLLKGKDNKSILISDEVTYSLKKNEQIIQNIVVSSNEKKMLFLSNSISVLSFESGDNIIKSTLKTNDDKSLYNTSDLLYFLDEQKESGEILSIKAQDNKSIINSTSLNVEAEVGLPAKLDMNIVSNDNTRLLNTRDISMNFKIAGNTLDFKKNKDGISLNTSFIIAKKQKILVIETILKNEINFGFELNYSNDIDFDNLFEVKKVKEVDLQELLKNI